MQLRPLIVVTGSVHVEGGDENTRQQHRPRRVGDVEKITVTHKRVISKDRRAGNVVSTAYMRRLRALRLLKTPYGTLIEPSRLPEVKKMFERATRDVAKFNAKEGATAHLENCLIWEQLRGNRLAAVEGWAARKLRENDLEIHAILTTPTTASAA